MLHERFSIVWQPADNYSFQDRNAMDTAALVLATGARTHNFKNIKISRIAIDSRTLHRGDCFIAIKGDRFDGHDFVVLAARAGARCVIISNRFAGRYKRFIAEHRDLPVLIVPDTLRALGDIAHYHRMRFSVPVIAITGSSGKTTVKELTSHLLGGSCTVLKTEGTRNNLIGLPLTLLGMNNTHDACVLEMGTNVPGEIQRLAEIAAPTIGVITNIGPSHLEGLGSIRNVFKEKSCLLHALAPASWAVLNGDDALLRKAHPHCRISYFGVDRACHVRGLAVKAAHDGISFTVGRIPFTMGLLGMHNIANALAGIGVGRILGLDMKSMAKRLKDYENPLSNRLFRMKANRFSIINDSYNANPLSFKTAVQSLIPFKRMCRCVIISSDMLELGVHAKKLHRECGRIVAGAGIGCLVTVGKLAGHISQGAVLGGMDRENIYHFRSREEAERSLPDIIKNGDMVLVKGSRTTRMENIVEALKRI
ncbi:MAG: UDP-N-acetylmuramoyl-tripeptide--D-alanyl-D-alanine ligase [Candidatus Omnitrophica bacterium]|nr:UDP-N-acetylmuramoyl-tripeptide--D-alanyl-D-alanine ligase [Candidatus Omnitrophota bacterium]